MGQVVLEGEEPNGLAQMIAGLVEGNVAADAQKARLLESARGAVQIDVPDADVTIALKFVPGTLTVASTPVAGADLRITAESETLLGLSAVPLRWGLPDTFTPEGREVAAKVLRGELKLRGLPTGIGMLRTVNRLLNVA